jgi:hypothetical protein
MTVKELKAQLDKEYSYRIEMHAHTRPISPCSDVTAADVAEIYSKQNYDAIVLTNHYALDLCEGMDKYSAADMHMAAFEELKAECAKYGMTALLGSEVRFAENHNDYLIYGVDRNILSQVFDYFDKGLEAYRTEVKLEKSVFLQAHPFRDGNKRANPAFLDGVEVFNMHPHHNSRVGLAAKFAKENGFDIITSGTDFHHPNCNHEGVSALRTRVLPKDSFDLAEILKNGDYLLEVSGTSLILA